MFLSVVKLTGNGRGLAGNIWVERAGEKHSAYRKVTTEHFLQQNTLSWLCTAQFISKTIQQICYWMATPSYHTNSFWAYLSHTTSTLHNAQIELHFTSNFSAHKDLLHDTAHNVQLKDLQL
jgi:hypothetical protein